MSVVSKLVANFYEAKQSEICHFKALMLRCLQAPVKSLHLGLGHTHNCGEPQATRKNGQF